MKYVNLPLAIEIENKKVLKKTAAARAALAELKGTALSIPNEHILVNTLSLQEAKDSSAIENIITTHDELYQSDSLAENYKSLASKEIYHYNTALKRGYEIVKATGLLLNRDIIRIQSVIKESNSGFRKQAGTTLKNEKTQEVIYTPPQTQEEIIILMSNLEKYINDEMLSDEDPLVKMAIIHHQFESIHPFYDGNGRVGRIINILYLVKEDLLESPILYLSRYINQHKQQYYALLQKVRDEKDWESWVLFILEAVIETSKQTIRLIHKIKELMLFHKNKIREELPKIYSQDLLNNIFKHPYTKIHFMMDELNVSRITAVKYLEELKKKGILHKEKIGKENFYINVKLYELLSLH
ncbi:Fic family protein [Aureivirga sp. CE67]|uniref:Fic family protein n=1 Tax=Aureivirga sp. CE67 TaxID=1788983 RepID=UPI0018C9C811|nr:Fic/DOC family N-terminal domain-containing protein [Aureivirga sp. CE67]